MIDCETAYPNEVLEKLKEELKNINVTEKEFERRKKTGNQDHSDGQIERSTDSRDWT